MLYDGRDEYLNGDGGGMGNYFLSEFKGGFGILSIKTGTFLGRKRFLWME